MGHWAAASTYVSALATAEESLLALCPQPYLGAQLLAVASSPAPVEESRLARWPQPYLGPQLLAIGPPHPHVLGHGCPVAPSLMHDQTATSISEPMVKFSPTSRPSLT